MSLRTARQAAGLTQPDLARRSGCSVRTISYVECGRVSPRQLTKHKLLQGLGIAWAERERVFPCHPIGAQ